MIRNQEIRSVASRVCCLKQWSCGLILVVIICVQICYYFTNIPNALQKDAKRHLSAVSCKRLLVGDKSEVKKAVQILRKYTHQAVPDAVYSRVTRNCTSYVEKRQYLSRKITDEEVDFPIAFAILTYKDVEMTERLLRAIYRPHNFYCIHIDSNSPHQTQRALTSIASCFHNVFIASTSYNVEWGKATVLYAEIQCMKDLLRYRTWKYFINLTGQEFPLKTNRELVKILKAYSGANDIHSDIKLAKEMEPWTKFVWDDFLKPSRQKAPPPHGIRLAKGEAHVVVSRAFVDYIVNNDTSKDFLKWISDTRVPDEFYFQSLNINPQLGVPGAHNGSYGTRTLVRYKLWVYDRTEQCGGVVVRGICNFGIRDLPGLTKGPQLFGNKFTLKFEPLTYKCMEQWLDQKERSDILKMRVDFYRDLPFVKGSQNRQNNDMLIR